MPDLLAENPGQAPGEGHTPRRKSSNHYMRATSEPPRKIDNNINDSDNVYMTVMEAAKKDNFLNGSAIKKGKG